VVLAGMFRADLHTVLVGGFNWSWQQLGEFF
jgi:hypothetical protein